MVSQCSNTHLRRAELHRHVRFVLMDDERSADLAFLFRRRALARIDRKDSGDVLAGDDVQRAETDEHGKNRREHDQTDA